MNQKEQVGLKAATLVKDGMIVGLGTGSTAKYLVEALAERHSKEELDFTGVTTSNQTAQLAKSLKIPMKKIDEVDHIDLTIDGADEFSMDNVAIKGGGGALLYEKIVASYSQKLVLIMDESKLVAQIGAFPLAVEVVRFGSTHLLNYFTAKGYQPSLRMEEGGAFQTDDGNYIIDLSLEKIDKPSRLAMELSSLAGVVEHGLFVGIADQVIIGSDDGPQLIDLKK